MKIIISPSKNQNRPNQLIQPEILNFNKTVNLFKTIKNLKTNELQTLFKIKDNLLEEVEQLYHGFNVSNHTSQAIEIYSGVVFEQIKHDEYNQFQTKYLNENLIILSAMYGVLKPKTFIWPYRLDFTIKPNKINLYHYWQEDIENFFDKEELIINLASNEFSKLLTKHQEHIININFFEEQKDKSLKVISYNAKKARGIMVNELILNLVKDINQIKEFNIDGYIFSQEQSDDKNFCFIKKYNK